MLEALSTSTNSVHRNCEFLKFLKQLNNGALTLNEETQEIQEDAGKMAEFAKEEADRLKEEEIRQKEEAEFEKQRKETLNNLVKEDDLDQIQDEDK